MSAVQMKTEDVKARPILFSGAMVKSILSGAKTQTRRVITPHPVHDVWKDWTSERLDHWLRLSQYQVGGRLWVRETWGVASGYDAVRPGQLEPHGMKVAYHASGGTVGVKVRPSIFMPRWASRITLEITGVRVERLQDISEEDAKAEGIDSRILADPANPDSARGSYRVPFAEGWDSLNAKRGYGWDVNPFVWVISFNRAI